MIIDAVDLLYTGRFASFCIVSSDSDFTRLAARIREQGVTVYGFGERKTNHAFIAACDKFMYFDVLNVDTEVSIDTSQASKAGLRPVTIRTQTTKRPLDMAAVNAIGRAIMNVPSYSEDWVNLAPVGTYLNRVSPNFLPKNYGYERLRDFVEASGIVECETKYVDENKPPIVLARIKEVGLGP